MNAIAYYLNKARVPCEIIGYTMNVANMSTISRNMPVTYHIIKSFDEKFGAKVMERCKIPSLHTYGSTPSYDGLHFGLTRLWARPERKKVCFELTDGEPFGMRCVRIGSNGQATVVPSDMDARVRQAYKDLIARAIRVGIHMFGFGIEQDVSWAYGDDCVLVNEDSIGEELVKKLTEILNPRRA
jgi:hypothetical protein